MGTAQLSFAVVLCGGATGSQVTGSHVTESDVSHITGVMSKSMLEQQPPPTTTTAAAASTTTTAAATANEYVNF
jgi:hypothetical protein